MGNFYQTLINSVEKYMNFKDEYNENRLIKVSKKLKASAELSRILGLKEEIVAGIIVGDELSKVDYDKTEEASIDKERDVCKFEFSKTIMNKILNDADELIKKAINEGIDYLEKREDKTPEQKLAFMIIDGFEYSDALKTQQARDICFINYKNRILEYSKKAGQLAGPIIPELKNPREKINRKSISDISSNSNLNER